MARRGVGGYVASGAVLLVTAGFLVYAIGETRDPVGPSTTPYRALFSSSDGLAPGSPVTLGGVMVGRVASIQLDTGSMVARVGFEVRRDVSLAPGTRLSISSPGFGGGGALAVTPGNGAGRLRAGAVITDTTPSRSLEAAVGDYIFGSGLSSRR